MMCALVDILNMGVTLWLDLRSRLCNIYPLRSSHYAK